MRTGANILWFLLGGWFLALTWLFGAVVMAISVIGLPWARACFEIAKLSLAPFGREVISHAELSGGDPLPVGIFRLLANLLWLPFGLVLTLSHLMHGCMMFVTIIGIPLALQDFKLAGISLFPVGKRVVLKEVAEAARAANAAAAIAARRQ
nr:YccF family protein [Oryzibacter oryziterrae]